MKIGHLNVLYFQFCWNINSSLIALKYFNQIYQENSLYVVIIFLDQKVIMRSIISRTQSLLCCLTCGALFAGVVLLILDIPYVGSYQNLQRQIDNYYVYLRCYKECSPYTYQFNDQCCLDYDHKDCISKNGCNQNQFDKLRSQQNGVFSVILALSILSGILILISIICMVKLCKRPTSQNQTPLLFSQQAFNINQSLASNQRRIETGYESFAHIDQQNACCICLQEFNNEKAILLKCGHIFHSTCIRDWSAKQQNCPICRSSQ